MTAKDLLDAASVLDDKYVQEAEARAAAVVPAKRRNIRIISGITAAAACLTVAVGLRLYNIGMTEQSSTAESEIAEMTETDIPAATDITGEKPQIATTIAESAEHAQKVTGAAGTTTAPSAQTSKNTSAKNGAASDTAKTGTAKASGQKQQPVPVQFVFEHLQALNGSGTYHMELRENGRVRFTGPSFATADIGDWLNITMTAEGTGTAVYDAVLVREDTGSEAAYSKFRVNYENRTAETISDSAAAACEQLDGSYFSKDFIDYYGPVTFFNFLAAENNQTKTLSVFIPHSAKGRFAITAAAENGSDEARRQFTAGSGDPFTLTLRNAGLVRYHFTLTNLENGRTVSLPDSLLDFHAPGSTPWLRSDLQLNEMQVEFDAFRQLDGIDTETVYGGDFDLDGRITAADCLIAEMIRKAEDERVLDMLPLTAEQLARAEIGAGVYPSEAICDTWQTIQVLGCTGLSVEGYLANEESYKKLCWESYKNQIDWTKLGLNAVPTYEEFLMLTDTEYMSAHTENWESLLDYEQGRLWQICLQNHETYEQMEYQLRIRPSGMTNTANQTYVYVFDLASQRYVEESIYDEEPLTWEELWSKIESYRDK